MPTVDDVSISGLISTPLALPILVAGALMVSLSVMAFVLRSLEARQLFLSMASLIIGAMIFVALHHQLVVNELAAERRALLARHMTLTETALADGSSFACLDGVVGEAIENDCEKTIFTNSQNTARAVAYTAARLTLLRAASEFAGKTGEADLLESFASARRMIALDRYGLAAQVLAIRDRCTAERCYAFTLVEDADALKANLKNSVFDRFVAHYSGAWPKGALSDRTPAAGLPSSANAENVNSAANAGARTPSPDHPLDSRWDFPSAASIPPVSIMDGEATPSGGAEGNPAEAPLNGGNKSTAVPVPIPRPQLERETSAVR